MVAIDRPPLPYALRHFRSVTGRIKIREVDVTTETYHVARKYMIRLERDDLVDPERLAALAKVAAMKPDEFKARYAHVVAGPAALEVSRD
jgi:6-phosphofructokinase 1